MKRNDYKKDEEFIEVNSVEEVIEINSTDEVIEEEKLEEVKETETEIKVVKKSKSTSKPKTEKKSQEFKVYSIVNKKSVMAKGLEDGKWYSKPNNDYIIGEIIK